jgi:hypothetical protein
VEYYTILAGKTVKGISEKRSKVHPPSGAFNPLSLPGLLAVFFSITYVTSYQLTWCNTTEDLTLNQKIPKFTNLISCGQTAHSLGY